MLSSQFQQNGQKGRKNPYKADLNKIYKSNEAPDTKKEERDVVKKVTLLTHDKLVIQYISFI